MTESAGRDGGPQVPQLDPDRDSTLILLVGRKGSGKSVVARELFRSWEHDRVVIDVNGDAEPGPDAERVQVPIPHKFPGHAAGSLMNEPSRSLHFRADPGAPTYRDDLDRAVGLALYPQDRPVLVWIDEIGEVCPPGATPPHLRRLLMQSRHYHASALMCGPRPMNIDPLCISQADLIYIFTLPNPRDRERLADSMGYPPKRLAAELDETARRGKYWFLLWDAQEGVLWRMPPVPVTEPTPGSRDAPPSPPRPAA